MDITPNVRIITWMVEWEPLSYKSFLNSAEFSRISLVNVDFTNSNTPWYWLFHSNKPTMIDALDAYRFVCGGVVNSILMEGHSLYKRNWYSPSTRQLMTRQAVLSFLTKRLGMKMYTWITTSTGKKASIWSGDFVKNTKITIASRSSKNHIKDEMGSAFEQEVCSEMGDPFMYINPYWFPE
jgi:hypothetical protein